MESSELLNWASLGSYAGSVMFTTLATQFIKDVGFLKRIPTRLISYVIATVILLLAYFFTATTYNATNIVLCFVNAVIVALAANGAFEMMVKSEDKKSQ